MSTITTNAQHLAVDEQGSILVGAPPAAQPDIGQPAEAERQLYNVLLAVMALLRRERRVTYRALRHVFGLHDACLHAVRDELLFREVAREEDDQGLVWTGEDVSRTSEDVAVLTPARVHSGPDDAERRQLTVLFCDEFCHAHPPQCPLSPDHSPRAPVAICARRFRRDPADEAGSRATVV